MKLSNSKERLKEMMDKLGLKQVDICKKCGIQKSALSNYLNGTREPRQDQISLICDPYGINPTWLMGYDVPMFIEELIHKDPIAYAKHLESKFGVPSVSIETSEKNIESKTSKALKYYEKYESLSPENQEVFDRILESLLSTDESRHSN